MPSTRPGYGSGARPLREAGAVRCRFSRSDCRLLNLLFPRARGEGGRFGAAPHLFAPLRVARRVRRLPLRAGRQLLREVLGHFGSASPPFLCGFIRLRARLVLASWEYPSPFYCLIWMYLDADVLVLPSVFLPQDSIFVGRPTTSSSNARPPVSQFFCLCWCGLSRAGFLSFPALFSLRVSISRSTGILGIWLYLDA